MTGGAGRSVSWTSFNMAAQVTEGTTTVAFAYDSDHARITQTIGGASPSTTTYLNAMGAVSEKFVAGATTTWHDYVYAAGNLVAERFCSGAAPCSTGAQMRYAVSDHLSSPSSLTDETGAVTERLSYDAWGQRRNANGTDALCGAIASATTRGYTGHEMLDAVCLVNMNARLYDPAIGRFMSADSIVPDPLDGQAYNRYAYVLGNPLRYTDPTGLADDDKNPQIIIQAIDPHDIEQVVVTGHYEPPRNNPTPPPSIPNVPVVPTAGNSEGGGGGGNGGKAPPAPDKKKDPFPFKVCTGNARVLQGNPLTIGKPGGLSTPNLDVLVTAESAAVIPDQFGTKEQLRDNRDFITGVSGNGTLFNGIGDVIGGKSPTPGMNVRDALEARNPNTLILELPGAPNDQGTIPVIIIVPNDMQCPAGTG